ncbi:hypothetical protein BDZ89DRAFT_1129898 [Hymenopellis radicata]|nr:hypothetical protein BDZ89DRAFT_1129898 [Hymenopellis radicata]
MSPTSPSISPKVLANAPSYRQIQASLADLRDVPLVFAYQTKRVKSLESDLSQAAESVKKCAETTKKEREAHERIRDSTARKLAYKLTRRKEKYEEKASREERYTSRTPYFITWI